MSLNITAITFDCQNASRLAAFWAEALGRAVDSAEEVAGDFFASIGWKNPTAGQPTMMFLGVPEGRTVKNRVHLDLDASDRAAEVDRLVGLGATVVHEKSECEMSWTTLTDPEGNEFCIAEH